MKLYTAVDNNHGLIIEFEAQGYKAAKRQLARINRVSAETGGSDPDHFEWMPRKRREKYSTLRSI